MHELSGKTSDRIRSAKGKIPTDALTKGRNLGDEPPTPEAIMAARGRGMGRGPTGARSGGA